MALAGIKDRGGNVHQVLQRADHYRRRPVGAAIALQPHQSAHRARAASESIASQSHQSNFRCANRCRTMPSLAHCACSRSLGQKPSMSPSAPLVNPMPRRTDPLTCSKTSYLALAMRIRATLVLPCHLWRRLTLHENAVHSPGMEA